MTRHDALLAAFIAALSTPSLVAEEVLEDGDADALQETTETAVLVSFDGATATPMVGQGAPVNWDALIRVDSVVRDNRRTSAGQPRPASQLHQAVHQRITASAAISGLVVNVQLAALRSDRELRDTRMGNLIAVYRCEYRSTPDTLE